MGREGGRAACVQGRAATHSLGGRLRAGENLAQDLPKDAAGTGPPRQTRALHTLLRSKDSSETSPTTFLFTD